MSTIPSPKECQEFLNVAAECAAEAGKVLRHYWGNLSQISAKTTTWDLVTEADQEAERLIISLLRSHFPTHAILAEESGKSAAGSEDYLWAIDPLDGTTNYTHQYPMVATSIGLLFQNKPLIGVIFNPILNELFLGARGCGATLNGAPLKVSSTTSLDRSLLASGFAYDRKTSTATNYREFCRMTHITQGVRRGGAAAIDLAYVAAGRLDGYWERGLQPWDMAAGALLIEEAGGRVTDYTEGPVDFYSGRILATNGNLHALISQELLTLHDSQNGV